jgi:uncharacterized protein (DUF302 family)
MVRRDIEYSFDEKVAKVQNEISKNNPKYCQ